MLGSLVKFFNPILYQGANDGPYYFERWYFKQTAWGPLTGKASRKERAMVFTPGIVRSPDGDFAFVQTLDGASGASRHFAFPASAFSTTDDPFEIRIGDNRFSLTGINLDLSDDQGHIGATIRFGETKPPHRTTCSPGVMGPAYFLPNVRCRYDIASLDHSTEGFAWVNDHARIGPPDPIIFNGGRGYIAKTWGRAMPEHRIWIQANDFEGTRSPTSFVLNLVRIDTRKSSFNGFLCILLIAGVEYRFRDHSDARIDLLEYEGPTIHILLSDRSYKLEVQVRRSHEGKIITSPSGSEKTAIIGSADAWTRILLKRRHGASDELVFDSSSPAGAVELVGELDRLKP